ncbi:hypothetical protein ACIQOF_36235 [Streptomyces sp. NPDC091265]
MITYNCWDVTPVWGALLGLPLEIGGCTRAITFERHDQGQQARRSPPA